MTHCIPEVDLSDVSELPVEYADAQRKPIDFSGSILAKPTTLLHGAIFSATSETCNTNEKYTPCIATTFFAMIYLVCELSGWRRCFWVSRELFNSPTEG